MRPKPPPYVDPLYARKLRADSTAVSFSSSNQTDPPAWTASYYTIHVAKRTNAEDFNAPWTPTRPCGKDDRMSLDSEKLEVPFTAS
jgi:hypothetical protein